MTLQTSIPYHFLYYLSFLWEFPAFKIDLSYMRCLRLQRVHEEMPVIANRKDIPGWKIEIYIC